MLGFLNIYKPSGITSNGVVQKLKKKFHIDKIGHMGTLDPLASGILPIAIGKATRMFDYSLNKTKIYTAIFDFGYTTDTLDIEGVKTNENSHIPSKEELIEASNKLLGEIEQVPPLYSAKCVNGKRAYELARQGVNFELKPKKITIFKIELVDQISDFQFKFDITCSSGTYIRAIGRDIAELCGTYACMSFLERTQTGNFDIDNSIQLEDILSKDNLDNYLITPVEAFSNFNTYNVSRDIANDIINGKRPKCEGFNVPTFILSDNILLGVARCNVPEIIIDTFLYEQKDK